MPLRLIASTLRTAGARLLQAASWGIVFAPAVALACTDKTSDVRVEAVFIEGAPIDRLLVTNRSAGGWLIKQITWDLTPSAGEVIFDTTGSGAGVEVFQPFRQLNTDDTRSAGGNISDDRQLAVLVADPSVTDGDQSVLLQFKSFEPQQVFGMSIDVDDQVSSRQITVDRSEMQGAILQVVFSHKEQAERKLTASFDKNAQASVCE